MYECYVNNQKIVICTPQSKIHKNGHGWFDLFTIQVELLDKANIAILAIRMEGNKVYYIDFKDLRNYMTTDMMLSYSQEKWSYYVWNDYITIRGNNKRYFIDREKIVTTD